MELIVLVFLLGMGIFLIPLLLLSLGWIFLKIIVWTLLIVGIVAIFSGGLLSFLLIGLLVYWILKSLLLEPC